MATLDYIDIPPCATRLDPSQHIQPAHKIPTNLPQPDPTDSNAARHPRSNSNSSSPGIISSGPMSFIPQILMGSIPTSIPVTNGSGSSSTSGAVPLSPTNPRKKSEPEKVTLLSSKDPLSLPIMTNNFKRFVAKVGPVFWFQDRVEEVLFWKRGWKRTTVWMALYVFLCYFPRMILLLPHAIFIGVILSTYPYSSSSISDTSPPVSPQPPAEGTAAWQANLQAIQNLMGFVSDMTTLAQPYAYHLSLTPLHLTPSTSQISPRVSSTTRSPYTPHILTLLVVTFFPLLILIHLPGFPLRPVIIIAGLIPFLITHPTIRILTPSLLSYTQTKLIPNLLNRYEYILSYFNPSLTPWLHMPLQTTIERLIDNDRLPDEIWRSEKREVELFENERYESTIPVTESNGQGWNKMNLRPGERSAWTRGRDGWTGIGVDDEISSNLTFSLSPNWHFIPTEDWRKDLSGAWAECTGGADEDGWVYTNDSWVGARKRAYSAGGGSVTRRRRWVRRVWFDSKGTQPGTDTLS